MSESKRVIFVFGSNEAGIHGLGDALLARRLHGAIVGKGEGLQGNSYGLPTKNRHIQSLPLDAIERNVGTFIALAKERDDLVFDVQAVACRLAGYTPEQIAPFFAGCPENVYVHPLFAAVLRERGIPHRQGPAPRPGQSGLF